MDTYFLLDKGNTKVLYVTINNNNQYRSFIKYAISTCDSFSLVYEKSDIDKTKYVLQDFYDSIFNNFLHKENIGIHPGTGTIFENSDIVYYLCNKEINNALQSADSIFDWNGKYLPEELCFYRNKEIWFICIYHENLLVIHNETKDDIEFFKKLK